MVVRRSGAAMTSRLVVLGVLTALGSLTTAGLVSSHGPRPDPPLDPESRREMNRDIERRLDLVVNGTPPQCSVIRNSPGPVHAPGAFRFLPRPQPCSSPEPWRTNP